VCVALLPMHLHSTAQRSAGPSQRSADTNQRCVQLAGPAAWPAPGQAAQPGAARTRAPPPLRWRRDDAPTRRVDLGVRLLTLPPRACRVSSTSAHCASRTACTLLLSWAMVRAACQPDPNPTTWGEKEGGERGGGLLCWCVCLVGGKGATGCPSSAGHKM
jgi:hypothetical protein